MKYATIKLKKKPCYLWQTTQSKNVITSLTGLYLKNLKEQKRKRKYYCFQSTIIQQK